MQGRIKGLPCWRNKKISGCGDNEIGPERKVVEGAISDYKLQIANLILECVIIVRMPLASLWS